MSHTPESIAALIAEHRNGTVSTLALYDKLRFLAAGCATLEKERDELQRDKARLDRLQGCEVIVSTADEGADIFGHNAYLNEGHDLRAAIDDAFEPEPITESKP